MRCPYCDSISAVCEYRKKILCFDCKYEYMSIFDGWPKVEVKKVNIKEVDVSEMPKAVRDYYTRLLFGEDDDNN